MLNIRIYFFGIYRELNMDYIFIEIPKNSNILFLREKLIELFKTNNFKINYLVLLESSVFADENNILNDDYVFIKDYVVTLLPPVSGG